MRLRLGIFCNFGPPSIGGSEEVIKQIARNLSIYYDVTIYSHSQKNPHKDDYDGVMHARSESGDYLISQINENDHILVYSDSFWGWDTIVENIDKVVPDVSVALVGAYYMQSHPAIFDLLKKNIDKFNLITHSSTTPDHKWCIDNDLPVKVIPNGVDLSEFSNNTIDFREKYKIKEKYILLNVAQFFYGKGQSSLGLINKELKRYTDDFIIVQISSSIDYPYEQRFLRKAKKNFNNEKCLFLRNIPREDVVSAFKNSDVFCFTSGKEVAPLVILESMAAGLPFVSLPVGDISNYPGVIINTAIEDKKGYKIIDKRTVEVYAYCMYPILVNDDLRKRLIRFGQEEVEKLDWKNIVPQYDGIFSS